MNGTYLLFSEHTIQWIHGCLLNQINFMRCVMNTNITSAVQNMVTSRYEKCLPENWTAPGLTGDKI